MNVCVIVGKNMSGNLLVILEKYIINALSLSFKCILWVYMNREFPSFFFLEQISYVNRISYIWL